MLKALKNIGLFQKVKNLQKDQNPDEQVSSELKPRKKTMQPHSNDMCCGKCGGNSRKET